MSSICLTFKHFKEHTNHRVPTQLIFGILNRNDSVYVAKKRFFFSTNENKSAWFVFVCKFSIYAKFMTLDIWMRNCVLNLNLAVSWNSFGILNCQAKECETGIFFFQNVDRLRLLLNKFRLNLLTLYFVLKLSWFNEPSPQIRFVFIQFFPAQSWMNWILEWHAQAAIPIK